MASRRWDLLLGAALLLACGMSTAAESLFQSVQECAAEADASQRLACYDRAAERWVVNRVRADGAQCGSGASGSCASTGAQPAGASAQPAASVPASSTRPAADREPASLNSAKSVFGADGLTRKQQLGGEGAQQRRLTALVTAIARRPQGMLVLHLENGQVWEQTEDGPDLKIQAGDAVTIDRGVLGAYWLSARPGHVAIKVRRTE
jgi:hypothetical protein